jgi:hypothetical protein
MTTKLRIICGPEAMFIERHGVRSREVRIGMPETPADLRSIGRELWAEISPFVIWSVWLRHRLRMAKQRKYAAFIAMVDPEMRHPGPRPWHIARKPWAKAKHGEWTILPPGVVARLVRGHP